MIRPAKLTLLSMAALAVLAVLLSACGGQTANPTAAVDAIYTHAAATVEARMTQTAASYSSTPSISETPAISATPGATQTPLITDTPTSTLTPIVINTKVPTAQASCDNMTFVSDVTIPDGSSVAPGASFVKTWKVRNNGPCTWNTNYRLIFGWSSDSWADIRKSPPSPVKLTQAVVPGAEYDLSVTLKAPVKTGSYQAAFRLQNDKGYNFGTILYVLFQVKGTATP